MDPKDAAQAALTRSGIRPGQIYRHYNGGLYSVVAVCIKEDTLEPMVVYQSNVKGSVWTRTLANWSEDVAQGMPGEPVPRFERETD